MNIIFPVMDYRLSLTIAGVDTLEDRREASTERFYNFTTSCLHCLLPDRRDSDILNKLRQPNIFKLLAINIRHQRPAFSRYGGYSSAAGVPISRHLEAYLCRPGVVGLYDVC